jgi:ABC-type uncharacterized transport system permease subunit
MTEPIQEEEAAAPTSRGRVRRALAALKVPFLALVAALVCGAIFIVFTNPETLRAWASFFRNPGAAI